jgi:hypothetical protein
VDQSLHSRPDRTDTVRPVPSIIVRGSCRLSVEHCRSNSTRRPFVPSEKHQFPLPICRHIVHVNLVQIITIWMRLRKLKIQAELKHLTCCNISYEVRHRILQMHIFVQYQTKTKQTPWPEPMSKLYPPSNCRLSAKLVSTFADRGSHVVRVTDPYGRILGFLDRSSYFFFQVAPQLYSRGWVDPNICTMLYVYLSVIL